MTVEAKQNFYHYPTDEGHWQNSKFLALDLATKKGQVLRGIRPINIQELSSWSEEESKTLVLMCEMPNGAAFPLLIDNLPGLTVVHGDSQAHPNEKDGEPLIEFTYFSPKTGLPEEKPRRVRPTGIMFGIHGGTDQNVVAHRALGESADYYIVGYDTQYDPKEDSNHGFRQFPLWRMGAYGPSQLIRPIYEPISREKWQEPLLAQWGFLVSGDKKPKGLRQGIFRLLDDIKGSRLDVPHHQLTFDELRGILQDETSGYRLPSELVERMQLDRLVWYAITKPKNTDVLFVGLEPSDLRKNLRSRKLLESAAATLVMKRIYNPLDDGRLTPDEIRLAGIDRSVANNPRIVVMEYAYVNSEKGFGGISFGASLDHVELNVSPQRMYPFIPINWEWYSVHNQSQISLVTPKMRQETNHTHLVRINAVSNNLSDKPRWQFVHSEMTTSFGFGHGVQKNKAVRIFYNSWYSEMPLVLPRSK